MSLGKLEKRKVEKREVEKPGKDPGRPHAKTVAYHEEASLYIAGGVNSNVRLGKGAAPLCFKSATGCTLVDLDDNEYVDYAAGMGPAILGHAPRRLIDAVAATLAKGQLYAGQSHLELELAKRLQSVLPCAGLIRFGMSGSEMVQAAIRVARAYTGKSRIVKFEGHYHGWFDNVLVNLSSGPGQFEMGEAIPLALQTAGQTASVGEDLAILPWNDVEALSAYLERHADEVAGLIMEPVMCNTGVIPPIDAYLEAVRELCDRYSVVFIMDEVITGFRLGIGGAQSYFGVTPDIATYAKAFGGGFPVAALAGKADIMDLFGTGAVNHSGTYNSNTVSIAAGIATLDLLAEGDGQVYRQIEVCGQRLIKGIKALAEREGVPLRVQGYAGVFYTFFSELPTVANYAEFTRCDGEMLSRFISVLQEEGVRPTARGTWLLTASHNEAIVDRTLDAIARAVRAL